MVQLFTLNLRYYWINLYQIFRIDITLGGLHYAFIHFVIAQGTLP